MNEQRNDEDAAESMAPIDEASVGLAHILHFITLKEQAKADDFERLMLGSVFEQVDTQKEDFSDKGIVPDAHSLLATKDFGRDYVWEIRMHYFMHQTATPGWLLRRADSSIGQVIDDIEPFAQHTR